MPRTKKASKATVKTTARRGRPPASEAVKRTRALLVETTAEVRAVTKRTRAAKAAAEEKEKAMQEKLRDAVREAQERLKEALAEEKAFLARQKFIAKAVAEWEKQGRKGRVKPAVANEEAVVKRPRGRPRKQAA